MALRPTVRTRKQWYRGECWYVLHDPFSNNFFRIRSQGYQFLSRLRPDKSVEQVWEECMVLDADGTPGQVEVIQLLTQLYLSNLLYSKNPADSAELFKRYNRRRQRETRSKLMSVLFLRIPVFDPDNLLKAIIPFIRPLMGPIGAVIWFLVVATGAKLIIDNMEDFLLHSEGLLAPDNLVLLYLGVLLVKVLHEAGHAIVCRYFGGEVHVMGFMLLIFSPLPYVDATSSWTFRSRWKRAFVGAAGMIVEIFIAAVMVFIWVNSGQGIIHSLAYNIIFIASISTVLFNINPLLRFDGYYILSDLIDVPNLHTRSRNQLIYLFEHYFFGSRDARGDARTLPGAVGLVLFGFASYIYRILIMLGIIFLVVEKFFILGLLLAGSLLITSLVMPPFRLIKYLATSSRLARIRARAWMVSLTGLSALVLLLMVLPAPDRFRAPGIIEAEHYQRVVNDSPGYLVKIMVPDGSMVHEGTALLLLSDRELEMDIQLLQARWRQLLAVEQKASITQIADLLPIRERKKNLAAKLKDLARRRKALIVRASQRGKWIAPLLAERVGVWLPRGSEVGMVINDSSFTFRVVVPQVEASRLFNDGVEKGEVRINGQTHINISVTTDNISPVQQETLPSAALGWLGGGDIAVSGRDQTGLKTIEPFFQISLPLHWVENSRLYHGQSGQLRLTLGSTPLMSQWIRSFRQLLQNRYQL